ncbi:hypothetical protein AYI68_g6870, partial [Smittium mucronatum]
MLLSLGSPKLAKKAGVLVSPILNANLKFSIVGLKKSMPSARSFSESESKNKKLVPKKVVKAPLDQQAPSKAIPELIQIKHSYNLKIEKPQWAIASFFAMDKPLFGLESFRETSQTGLKSGPVVDFSFESPYLSSVGLPKDAVLPELIRLGPFAESILGPYQAQEPQKNMYNQEDANDLVHDYLDAIEFSINNPSFRSIRSTRYLTRAMQPLSRYEKYLKNSSSIEDPLETVSIHLSS